MHLNSPEASAGQISVVIPAFRGIATICDCIKSIVEAGAGFSIEILVVESSNDGTVDLVRKEFPFVRILAMPSQVSAGQARNIGAREAKGPFVLFVDQDCVVPKDWIPQLLQEFDSPKTGAVGGSVGFRNWSNWSGSAVYFLEFLYHFPSKRKSTRNSNFLIGCNLACRKEVFQSVSFPEQTLAEDFLFSRAVQHAGWDVIYKPSLSVLHWNREGWKEFFRYNGKMGGAAARYQKKLGQGLYPTVARFPFLIFLSPVLILPRIALGLFGNWNYLIRFLLLLPMCLLGNWAWGWAFFKEVKSERT